MKKQNNEVVNKLIKETKKSVDYQLLPNSTIIECVAVTADGTEYIFDITFGQWMTIKKKPGVQYFPFQKGFAQFRNAIRTTYNN